MHKPPFQLFKKMAAQVPAYRSFLKKWGVGPASIKDFTKLPLTSKRDYIYSYSKKDLLWSGTTPVMSYASSGSSGVPTYWFSDAYTEERGIEMHDQIFKNVMGITKKEKVLVIVCFSMGLWIAGVYTMLATRALSKRGYNITVATPGLEKENIYGVFKHVAPLYDTVVFAGYPPFITDILGELGHAGIPLPKNLKVLAGGDKFTEEWRDTVQVMIRSDRASDIVNVYGTAETAILGIETPFSIFLRRAALKNKGLFKELFGEGSILPALFQFDAETTYIENVGEEIVLSINAAIPLMRYNLHDVGRVVESMEVKKILARHSLLADAVKHGFKSSSGPFVIIKARTDVAITYYAFNVYPEHLRAGLIAKGVAPFVTKSYTVYTKEEGKGKREKFYFEVELADGVKSNSKTHALISKSIIQHLIEQNTEFAKLHRDVGHSMLPTIILKPFGTLSFVKKGVKTVASVHGKKPRVLIR